MTDLLEEGAGRGEGQGKGGGGTATLRMTLVEGVVFVTPPTVSYITDEVESFTDEGRGVSLSPRYAETRSR
jgi:hypothetical protein